MALFIRLLALPEALLPGCNLWSFLLHLPDAPFFAVLSRCYLFVLFFFFLPSPVFGQAPLLVFSHSLTAIVCLFGTVKKLFKSTRKPPRQRAGCNLLTLFFVLF